MQKLKEIWLKYKSKSKTKTVLITCLILLILFLAFNKDQYFSSLVNNVEKYCNVQGINIHGQITTYIPEHEMSENSPYLDMTASENVIWQITDANSNEDRKAIIIEVDSPGGSPVAGEEIMNAINRSEKPVIALIRDWGVSAGYLAIVGADKIYASKYSDVGSIGVTASYLSNVDKNKEDGIKYEELSSGKFKDAGSPDRSLSKEEREIFLRDINIAHDYFVNDVAKHRNLSVDKVKSIADGSSMLGAKAKELGLIDEIGGYFEVSDYIESLIGEKPEVCW